ncbi:uncharacterized protein BDZ99DRAFT_471910 [Mytilinidion resinicola]|uniref:Uncharacterized protein n=1 Tax=Mytilinidion resinicola TaxID=574789 RepID=A0A6A6Z6H4_9PEZI|nr:uncharacterized protein BDZ99DRAFT_471910 [Mytilinidion resinicola]KAF2816701.1 hypothetical protein BDZ99DRAFT_471910 [Mytilinidion resinicola]
MATVTISGYSYQLTSDGTHDYASNQGTTYYYRRANTTQWFQYTAQVQSRGTTTQASSSSGGAVPARYSNRLAANVYDASIGTIRVRWGLAAQQRLLTEAANKGILVDTMKALTKHFTYLIAVRVGAVTAVIKSPPKDFSVDSLIKAQCSGHEHITAELTGKKKAHVYLTGKGSGATAYDNMSMSGESIMTSQGAAGYAIDASLSTGTYTMAGASASHVAAATTTAASSSTTTATSGTSSQAAWPWEDDPEYPTHQRRLERLQL